MTDRLGESLNSFSGTCKPNTHQSKLQIQRGCLEDIKTWGANRVSRKHPATRGNIQTLGRTCREEGRLLVCPNKGKWCSVCLSHGWSLIGLVVLHDGPPLVGEAIRWVNRVMVNLLHTKALSDLTPFQDTVPILGPLLTESFAICAWLCPCCSVSWRCKDRHVPVKHPIPERCLESTGSMHALSRKNWKFEKQRYKSPSTLLLGSPLWVGSEWDWRETAVSCPCDRCADQQPATPQTWILSLTFLFCAVDRNFQELSLHLSPKPHGGWNPCQSIQTRKISC